VRVTIEMYGPLRRFNKGGELRTELDVEGNPTVAELLASLGMDMDEPWNAGLNGTLAKSSDTVSDGSFLIVFPPIEGG
jgi:hypothetical protein